MFECFLGNWSSFIFFFLNKSRKGYYVAVGGDTRMKKEKLFHSHKAVLNYILTSEDHLSVTLLRSE